MIETLCTMGKNVYAVESIPTRQQVKELCQYKGQIYLTDYSCIYQENNRKRTVFILASEAKKLHSSRLAVAELTGMELSDIAYTYASIARQVSEWLNIRQKPNLNSNGLIQEWHYQHCTPALLESATIYDMKSAYWQIACRAKSLLCDIDAPAHKIKWRVITSQQEERWERCKILLEPFKRLRLAIIGVNSTGLSKTSSSTGHFYRGEEQPLPGNAPTCFQPLAQLTVRCAYELTQLASLEVESFYSNADNVTTMDGKPPTIWTDNGIEFRTRATGKLDLLGIGVWKCGEEQTVPYAAISARGCINPPTFAKLLPDPYFHEILLH